MSGLYAFSFILLGLAIPQANASNVCGEQGVDSGHSGRVTHCYCGGLYYPINSTNNPCLSAFLNRDKLAERYLREELAKPVRKVKLLEALPPESESLHFLDKYRPIMQNVPAERPPLTNIRISGKVIDGSTGKPLAGAKVFPEGYPDYGTVTDTKGAYILESVPLAAKQIHALLEATKTVFTEDFKDVVLSKDIVLEDQNLVLLPKQYFAKKIVIVLTWGENPTDLDSHFLTPAPAQDEVSFSHKSSLVTAENRTGVSTTENVQYPVSLDVDDTQHFGPETTSIDLDPNTLKLSGGKYIFGVYHYAGEGSIFTSGAIVKVYFDGKLKASFEAPKSGSQTNTLRLFWNVFKIEGDTIVPINEISNKLQDQQGF